MHGDERPFGTVTRGPESCPSSHRMHAECRWEDDRPSHGMLHQPHAFRPDVGSGLWARYGSTRRSRRVHSTCFLALPDARVAKLRAITCFLVLGTGLDDTPPGSAPPGPSPGCADQQTPPPVSTPAPTPAHAAEPSFSPGQRCQVAVPDHLRRKHTQIPVFFVPRTTIACPHERRKRKRKDRRSGSARFLAGAPFPPRPAVPSPAASDRKH